MTEYYTAMKNNTPGMNLTDITLGKINQTQMGIYCMIPSSMKFKGRPTSRSDGGQKRVLIRKGHEGALWVLGGGHAGVYVCECPSGLCVPSVHMPMEVTPWTLPAPEGRILQP